MFYSLKRFFFLKGTVEELFNITPEEVSDEIHRKLTKRFFWGLSEGSVGAVS